MRLQVKAQNVVLQTFAVMSRTRSIAFAVRDPAVAIRTRLGNSGVGCVPECRAVQETNTAEGLETGGIASDEVVLGCVTEDNPKFLGQTLRLLQSIRWFGGELAEARVVVGAVETIDRRARRTLESWGAEVRLVPRFEYPNGSANRLQLVPVLLGDTAASHILMFDCDTIVVSDPLPRFRRGVFQAKVAPFPTVTHACFERLFAHFGLQMPERRYRTSYSRTPTIPYFNAGMFSMSRDIAERLVPEWRRYNAILARDPALAAPCARHLHQAALTLALVATGVPIHAAGVELNYQLNDTRRPSRSYVATDPIILHYHDLVDEDGLLLPCPFPRAQQQIDRFNARLRDEWTRAMKARPFSSEKPAHQFVVLGSPRSGVSLTAQILATMGAHPGQAEELLPPDVYFPGGCGRRRDVHLLHRDILAALGATFLEPEADWTKLSDAARADATDRARATAGRSSLLYDESMTLFFPLWRSVLSRPFAVLVWREPLPAARALSRATGLPLVISLAVWEGYMRRMLSATTGLPRVLVSYEQLARGDGAALHEATGLQPVDPAQWKRMLLPTAGEDGSADLNALDPQQCALRRALQSGEALTWDIVPSMGQETRALLAAFARNEAAGRRAAELQKRLDAVTGSRVWRIGSRVAALLRRLT